MSALATQLASLQTTCWLLHMLFLSCLCIPVSNAVVELSIQSCYFYFQDVEKCDFDCV